MFMDGSVFPHWTYNSVPVGLWNIGMHVSSGMCRAAYTLLRMCVRGASVFVFSAVFV